MIKFLKKYHLVLAMLFMIGGAIHLDNTYGMLASLVALLNAILVVEYQSWATKSYDLHKDSVRILEAQNKLLEELDEENQRLHDAALRLRK